MFFFFFGWRHKKDPYDSYHSKKEAGSSSQASGLSGAFMLRTSNFRRPNAPNVCNIDNRKYFYTFGAFWESTLVLSMCKNHSVSQSKGWFERRMHSMSARNVVVLSFWYNRWTKRIRKNNSTLLQGRFTIKKSCPTKICDLKKLTCNKTRWVIDCWAIRNSLPL